MTVRDLKLAIACDVESDEVKSLNKFFDDLFSDISIYTDGVNPDLIFMKGGKFIMKQDLKNKDLDCRYDDFWEILEKKYQCIYQETRDIIQYKVEEAFKIGSLTPEANTYYRSCVVEDTFKMGSLTPYNLNTVGVFMVEQDFKMGTLTPKTL